MVTVHNREVSKLVGGNKDCSDSSAYLCVLFLVKYGRVIVCLSVCSYSKLILNVLRIFCYLRKKL